ncbi:hypothetical protein [Legionella parisiensis]|uniref:Uncharacterized protein n=1 Tax=Legionella parisiensis TaxID=45071 RepID=A0A1E5JMI6_9GAMM|nr:hypothetical protein [Legionella parisiensis]KTD41737.1 hypothetical protein Lpar_3054 [Legionella parisiensis]OEH45755.1 hypothetical protein lpari_03268 [Legionella parisiensis]STX75941.1 Uncharacterised protein [Legionella parisiensis]
MGKSNRKWEQIKATAEKEELNIDKELSYDPIDTQKELDEIERINHDPNNTMDEMRSLRNTLVGAPVRLPAQISDQENNLGDNNTAFEIDDPAPESPKIP